MYVHVDFVLQAVAVDAFVGGGVEPEHRRVHVELYFGREAVDDGVWVPFPDLQDGLFALGDEGVGFDGVDAVIVAGDE